MPRFENTEGSSSKFWAIEVAGKSHTVTYGRIGTAGTSKTKTFASSADATKDYERLVKEKVSKGYVAADSPVDVVAVPTTEPSSRAAKPARKKTTTVPAEVTGAPGSDDVDSSGKDRPSVGKTVRYENTAGLAPKFWSIAIEGDSLIITYGRIGTAGTSNTNKFASAAWVVDSGAYDHCVREKLAKGYVAVDASASTAATTKKPTQGKPKATTKTTDPPAFEFSFPYYEKDKAPFRMTPKGLIGLAQKINDALPTAENKYSDPEKPLRRAGSKGPHGTDQRLFIHLAEHGLVNVWRHDQLLYLFNQSLDEVWNPRDSDGAEFSAADVIDILSRLDGPMPHERQRLTCPLPDWSEVLEHLIGRTYEFDPDYFVKNWQRLPAQIHIGVQFLLVRMGRLPRFELDAERLTEVARATLTERFLRRAYLLREGKPAYLSLRASQAELACMEPDRRATHATYSEVLDWFTTPQNWQAALIRAGGSVVDAASATDRGSQRESDGKMSPSAFREIAGFATHDVLAPAIGTLDRYHSLPILHDVLATRSDSPDDLLAMAQSLTQMFPAGEGSQTYWQKERIEWTSIAAAACTVHGILRLQAKGTVVPIDYERFIRFDVEGPLVEALRVLGRDRTLARLKQLKDANPHDHKLNDPPALMQAWQEHAPVQRLLDQLRTGQLPHGVDILAAAGPAALAAIAGALSTAIEPEERDVLSRAALKILAGVADSNDPLAVVWDALVQCHLVNDDYRFATEAGPLITRILTRLPQERAEAILIRELDSKYPFFTRPFLCLAAVATPRVLEHAFALLQQHASSIREEAHAPFVEPGLRDLAAADPYMKRALESDESGILERYFGSNLERVGAERTSPVTRIQRLAATFAEASDLVSVYLLSSRDDKPGPLDVNRIGGHPIGFTKKTWPRSRKEPMDHVLTLRLSDVPGLREIPGFSEAAALAVFTDDVSEPNDTRLVLITEADLATGESTGELPSAGISARRFDVVAVRVPRAVFPLSHDEDTDEDDLSDAAERTRQLHGELGSMQAYVGGGPRWLQDPEQLGGHFVLQFDENFADLNLGGGGVMYVFSEGAAWQCT
jgi:predicted DNA-binding WGR domain protein